MQIKYFGSLYLAGCKKFYKIFHNLCMVHWKRPQSDNWWFISFEYKLVQYKTSLRKELGLNSTITLLILGLRFHDFCNQKSTSLKILNAFVQMSVMEIANYLLLLCDHCLIEDPSPIIIFHSSAKTIILRITIFYIIPWKW